MIATPRGSPNIARTSAIRLKLTCTLPGWGRFNHHGFQWHDQSSTNSLLSRADAVILIMAVALTSDSAVGNAGRPCETKSKAIRHRAAHQQFPEFSGKDCRRDAAQGIHCETRAHAHGDQIFGFNEACTTQRIADLERELGVPLFDRSERKLRLTVHGEIFLRESNKVLDGSEHAVALARRSFRGEVGTQPRTECS